MADHIPGTVYLVHFVRPRRRPRSHGRRQRSWITLVPITDIDRGLREIANGHLVTARYKHAGHYLGWAPEGRLAARLQQHRDGNGARLIQVIEDNGLEFILARTWEHADRYKERALKNTGGASRFCPACGVTPRH